MVTNSFENKVSLSPWLLCVLVHFCNEFLTFVEINKLSCKSEGSTLVTYISSPKEEHTTYLFWDYPKVDLFFCDRPIKDAHHTRGFCHNYLN
jgi:hypothetical protein